MFQDSCGSTFLACSKYATIYLNTNSFCSAEFLLFKNDSWSTKMFVKIAEVDYWYIPYMNPLHILYFIFHFFYVGTSLGLCTYMFCLHDLFRILRAFFTNFRPRKCVCIYYTLYSTINSLFKKQNKECIFLHPTSKVF